MNTKKANYNFLYLFSILYLISSTGDALGTYTARPARQVHTNTNSCAFIPGTNKLGSLDFGGKLSSSTVSATGLTQIYHVSGMQYMGLKIIGLPGTSWFVAHDFLNNYAVFYTDTSGATVKSFSIVSLYQIDHQDDNLHFLISSDNKVGMWDRSNPNGTSVAVKTVNLPYTSDCMISLFGSTHVATSKAADLHIRDIGNQNDTATYSISFVNPVKYLSSTTAHNYLIAAEDTKLHLVAWDNSNGATAVWSKTVTGDPIFRISTIPSSKNYVLYGTDSTAGDPNATVSLYQYNTDTTTILGTLAGRIIQGLQVMTDGSFIVSCDNVGQEKPWELTTCDPTCSTCFATGNAGCLGCSNGAHTLTDGVCSGGPVICNPGEFLDLGVTCYVTCPGAKFGDNDTGNCETTCTASKFGNSGNNLCEVVCSSGKFGNSGNSLCESPCTGGKFGDSATKTCVPTCPVGTWPNGGTTLCEACTSPCTACNTSATSCTGCNLATHFLSGASCQPCNTACNGCTGLTASTCITCASGYTNNSGTCEVSPPTPTPTTNDIPLIVLFTQTTGCDGSDKNLCVLLEFRKSNKDVTKDIIMDQDAITIVLKNGQLVSSLYKIDGQLKVMVMTISKEDIALDAQQATGKKTASKSIKLEGVEQNNLLVGSLQLRNPYVSSTLNSFEKNSSTVAGTTTSYSKTTAQFLALASSLYPFDASGIFIKFAQMIELIEKLGLINIDYGTSVQGVLDAYNGSGLQSSDSNYYKKRDKFFVTSSKSVGKLSSKYHPHFLEIGGVIKIVLYIISFCLKLPISMVVERMRRKQHVNIKVCKLVNILRRLHVVLFNLSISDIYFIGVRTVFHTKFSNITPLFYLVYMITMIGFFLTLIDFWKFLKGLIELDDMAWKEIKGEENHKTTLKKDLVVDSKRTLAQIGVDKPVRQFISSELQVSSLEYPAVLKWLSFCFMMRYVLFLVSIVALQELPAVTLVLLITLEVGYWVMNINAFIKFKHLRNKIIVTFKIFEGVLFTLFLGTFAFMYIVLGKRYNLGKGIELPMIFIIYTITLLEIFFMILGTIYSSILLFKKIFRKKKYPDSINIVIYYKKLDDAEMEKNKSKIKNKIREKKGLGNLIKPRNSVKGSINKIKNKPRNSVLKQNNVQLKLKARHSIFGGTNNQKSMNTLDGNESKQNLNRLSIYSPKGSHNLLSHNSRRSVFAKSKENVGKSRNSIRLESKEEFGDLRQSSRNSIFSKSSNRSKKISPQRQSMKDSRHKPSRFSKNNLEIDNDVSLSPSKNRRIISNQSIDNSSPFNFKNPQQVKVASGESIPNTLRNQSNYSIKFRKVESRDSLGGESYSIHDVNGGSKVSSIEDMKPYLMALNGEKQQSRDSLLNLPSVSQLSQIEDARSPSPFTKKLAPNMDNPRKLLLKKSFQNFQENEEKSNFKINPNINRMKSSGKKKGTVMRHSMFVEDKGELNLFNENMKLFEENQKPKNNNLMNSPSPKSRRDSIRRVSRNKKDPSLAKKKNRNSMFVHSSDINSDSENSKKSNSREKRGSLNASKFSNDVSKKTRKSVFSQHKSNTQPVNVQVIRLSAFNNDQNNEDKIKKATKKKKRVIEDRDDKKKEPTWVEEENFTQSSHSSSLEEQTFFLSSQKLKIEKFQFSNKQSNLISK